MVRYIKQFILLGCCLLIMFNVPSNLIAKEQENLGNMKFQNIANFYKEKKNTIDVLFIGDSNFNRAINPEIIWKNKHVTSYTLTSASQPAWVSYYLLKEAMLYQKPKVVLLDTNLFFAVPTGRDNRYCSVINAMSPSEYRLAAIMNKTANFQSDVKKLLVTSYVKDYYLSFVSKTFKKDKIKQTPSATKGFNMNVKQIPYQGYQNYMDTNQAFYNVVDDDVYYIDNIITLCHKKHIQIAFLRTPSAKEWSTSKYSLVANYAESRNIPYLDENIGPYTSLINWQRDTKDEGLHLNVYGANKATQVVADYLTQYYALPVQEDLDTIHNFEESARLVGAKIDEMVKEQIMDDVIF